VPEIARIALDGAPQRKAAWRTLLLHKPRGVVTTRRDPQDRKTIYDIIGEKGRGLIAVGRLDLATSGLLLLTSDTQLAEWITNPANEVPRIYAVTVRGSLTAEEARRLLSGIESRGDRLAASEVTIRKTSGRETHLTLELKEGKNKEVRRLLAVIGHDVTRLKRIKFGGLELGRLEPGQWRELSREELAAAFPRRRRT
jgi:23S rRNA pseudouridine2605 synthase